MIRFFTLFVCFLVSTSSAYERNRYVSPEIWETLSPYFLPEDHPIKEKLDQLFSKRVILNSKSLKKAGFLDPKPQKFSRTIVSKHKKFQGYYFKLFTDDQENIVDWNRLYARVVGAERVRQCIDNHQLHHLIKVPQKWIYPLPENPSPPESENRKNFILIAEDMEVYDRKGTLKKWKGPWVTMELLEAVYIVLQEVGLNDSVYPFNMPFCKKDRKIAFIDLEESYTWPVRFKRLRPYLSEEMQPFWVSLYLN